MKRRRGVSSAILFRSAGGFRASDQFNARAQALQHMTRVPVAIRLSSSSLLLMAKTRLNRTVRAILLLLANRVRRDIIQRRWMDSYLSIRIWVIHFSGRGSVYLLTKYGFVGTLQCPYSTLNVTIINHYTEKCTVQKLPETIIQLTIIT